MFLMLHLNSVTWVASNHADQVLDRIDDLLGHGVSQGTNLCKLISPVIARPLGIRDAPLVDGLLRLVGGRAST